MIIAFRRGSLVVFHTGFTKNEASNLSPNEVNALKRFAGHIVGLNADEIEAMRHENEWKEMADEKA